MPDRSGLYAGLLAIIGWGTGGLLIKTLPAISPVWITSIRSLVAALCFLALMLGHRGLRMYLFRLNALSTWELASYQSLFYFLAVVGYRYASVAEAALLLATTPLIVLIWSAIRGLYIPRHEKLGALVAGSGVVVIFSPNLTLAALGGSFQVLGLVASLGGSIVLALFVLRLRAMEINGQQPNLWGLNLLAFLVPSLFLLLAPFIPRYLIQVQSAVSGHMLWVAIALGVISTVLPGICYAYASAKLPPLLTTSLRFLTPLVATILAAFFLNEMPGFSVYTGGILILAGLLGMTFKMKKYH